MQTEKPEYLGLLNAISLAETEAGVYLRAWANATCDEELARTLRFVAARETSHGETFCRRIAELGFTLRHKNDPKSAEKLLTYADPKIADADKIDTGVERDGNPFREIEQKLAEGHYDLLTANMLTWYIAEEHDSGRRLREAYARVREKCEAEMKSGGSGHANSNRPAMNGPSTDAQAIMACMTEGFARLEKTLERHLRAA